MKLYYSRGACSLAVRITIHEMGIACEYESVDLKTKQTEKGEDYLKINPKGAVPTIKLSSGEVLTENAVIQQYLADKHKAVELLPVVGDIKRYHVLEWLNFVSTDLHKNFSPLFHPKVPEEVKDSIFRPILKIKFSFADAHIKNNPFLTGENMSLADSYFFVMLRWAENMKFDLNEWPNLSRFYAQMKQRKSVAQALKEEHLD